MKVLSCVFDDDFLCFYRKSEKVRIMHRCFKCRHFRRLNREMEKEEEEFFEEVERARKYSREALR